MLSFVRRYQILLSSFSCLLLSLYLVAPAAKGGSRADPIGPILIALMRPLQTGVRAVVWGTMNVYQGYLALVGLSAENVRLRSRVAELEGARNRLLESEATNKRLRELMDFRSELPPDSITASVIGNSASTWFNSILLDKGTSHGVNKGMGVVSLTGVVGQVVSATSKTAKVLLVTDPHSGVDVLGQQSRARGIVAGSLETGPIMKYVKRSEDLQEGERLVTSGLDGIFPKGLLVGTILKVQKKSFGLFQHVEVGLAVDPSRIEEVLVLRAQPAQAQN